MPAQRYRLYEWFSYSHWGLFRVSYAVAAHDWIVWGIEEDLIEEVGTDDDSGT